MAFGLLTGKYDRATVEAAGPRAGGLPRDAAKPGEQRPDGDKRLDGANPFGDTLFTDRNWKLVDALKAVASEAGLTPASIAYAWVNNRPGVTSTLLGISRVAQLKDNVASLDLVLTPGQCAALDSASAMEQSTIHSLFSPQVRQHAVFGGSTVRAWRE